MSLNSRRLIRPYIIMFILFIFAITFKVYQRVNYLQNQRKLLIHNFYDSNINNISYDEILDNRFYEKKIARQKIMNYKYEIKSINLKQEINNVNNVSPTNNNTFIIVIQIHSNIHLIRELLESLKKASMISDSLLIFSHDFYNDDINNIINSIHFAKYTQIFYPYSIQLHPNVFPGMDKCNICDKTLIRDAYAAQIKHHWWWQINQVFDHLHITKNYNSTILFLEDDNYVTEDFLAIYKLLENIQKIYYPECGLISLAAHEPVMSLYNKKKGLISFETWSIKKNKYAIAFDRRFWNAIKEYSHEFCYFDDYTWDNTLKYIGVKYFNNILITTIDGPRVFRVQTCNESNNDCKVKGKENNVDEIKKFIDRIKPYLYPSVVGMKKIKKENFTVTPLGHFSDERDHELCMYFTKNNVWY